MAAPSMTAMASIADRDPAPEVILSVQQVTKDFPGLRALDQVSIEVRSGEVLALLGQNGSGKSTLVKILAGVYAADSGRVITSAAAGAALHFIHQDLGVVDSLSTVENLAVGRPQGRAFTPLRHRSERGHAEALIAGFGAHFDVRARLSTLTPAERTIVAIARAMDGWPDPRGVLVLDEPTAALQGEEVGVLFTAVRRAAAAGAGVIFISHRLDEVIELADRVAVLRDGRLVAAAAMADLTKDRLATMITGHEVARGQSSPPPHGVDRRPMLSVRGLAGASVQEFDVDLLPGEIVGVAGNLGSGREDVCKLVFGALPRTGGAVQVHGKPLPGHSPRASVRAGVALVPADRRLHGAVMTHDLVENITLPALAPLTAKRVHLSRRREFADAGAWIKRMEVTPPLPRRSLQLFSGGNQQKVVLARWLRTAPVVLLVEEPTQGVDIGASATIRGLVVSAAQQGTSVLVSSSDPLDLIEMCSRVVVFRDGRITAELAGSSLTDQRLTRECLGAGAADDGPAEARSGAS